MTREQYARLAKEFRSSVLGNERNRLAVEALNRVDLVGLNQKAWTILESLHRLILSRQELYSRCEPNSLPMTVQRYCALQLAELGALTRPALRTLAGFPVRLELLGLNLPLSQFFVEHVLEKKVTKRGSHVLHTVQTAQARAELARYLTEAGLAEPDATWAANLGQTLPPEIPVWVLMPDDPTRPPGYDVTPGEEPGEWDSSNTGSGSGGVNGGSAIGGFHCPIFKGVSLDIVRGLDFATTAITTAASQEWLHGLSLPDGSLITHVSPDPLKPRDDWRTVPGAASNIGNGLIETGIAAGESGNEAVAVVCIVPGVIVRTFGAVWGWLFGGNSFVDP